MNDDLVKLYEFMKKRLEALSYDIYRDRGGGLAESNAKYMECKYWKEYIEREFMNDET